MKQTVKRASQQNRDLTAGENAFRLLLVFSCSDHVFGGGVEISCFWHLLSVFLGLRED